MRLGSNHADDPFRRPLIAPLMSRHRASALRACPAHALSCPLPARSHLAMAGAKKTEKASANTFSPASTTPEKKKQGKVRTPTSGRPRVRAAACHRLRPAAVDRALANLCCTLFPAEPKTPATPTKAAAAPKAPASSGVKKAKPAARPSVAGGAVTGRGWHVDASRTGFGKVAQDIFASAWQASGQVAVLECCRLCVAARP